MGDIFMFIYAAPEDFVTYERMAQPFLLWSLQSGYPFPCGSLLLNNIVKLKGLSNENLSGSNVAPIDCNSFSVLLRGILFQNLKGSRPKQPGFSPKMMWLILLYTGCPLQIIGSGRPIHIQADQCK
jgi:hypothetical protein